MTIPRNSNIPNNRAVSWASVSTGPQADDDKSSIPTQLEFNRYVAESILSALIVDEIIVPGHSRYYYTVAECAADMRTNRVDAFDRIIAHWERRDAEWLLIRDSDRIARTLSMSAEFVARTYDAGMRIYAETRGAIDTKRQAIEWISQAGLRAESNVMFLVDARKRAAPKLNARGLHTQGTPLRTHRLIRDERGQRTGVEVVPEMRRMLYDAITLLFEGIAYDHIEQHLFQRFGYGKAGRPFAPNHIYSLLTHPYLWGHTATGISPHPESGRPYPAKGMWIFEPGHDIPPSVSISYYSHEPLFDAETGAQVIAEIQRRFGHYKRKTNHDHWMSILFFCAECKRPMAIQTPSYYHNKAGERRAQKQQTYLRCLTPHNPTPSYPACTQRKFLREDKAREAADKWLADYISMTSAHTDRAAETLARQGIELTGLAAEIERLRGIISRLIVQRATAPPAADALYLEQINQHSLILKATEQRANALRDVMASTERETRERVLTADELRESDMAAFWNQPAAAINRKLRALLGAVRFAVRDGEVFGIMLEPPRWITRPRKPRGKL